MDLIQTHIISFIADGETLAALRGTYTGHLVEVKVRTSTHRKWSMLPTETVVVDLRLPYLSTR